MLQWRVLHYSSDVFVFILRYYYIWNGQRIPEGWNVSLGASSDYTNLFLFLFEVPLMDSWHFVANVPVECREHAMFSPHDEAI